jgi:hypothetical protein
MQRVTGKFSAGWVFLVIKYVPEKCFNLKLDITIYVTLTYCSPSVSFVLIHSPTFVPEYWCSQYFSSWTLIQKYCYVGGKISVFSKYWFIIWQDASETGVTAPCSLRQFTRALPQNMLTLYSISWLSASLWVYRIKVWESIYAIYNFV